MKSYSSKFIKIKLVKKMEKLKGSGFYMFPKKID